MCCRKVYFRWHKFFGNTQNRLYLMHYKIKTRETQSMWKCNEPHRNTFYCPLSQVRFVKNVTSWKEMKPGFYHGHISYLDFAKYVRWRRRAPAGLPVPSSARAWELQLAKTRAAFPAGRGLGASSPIPRFLA